MKKILFFCLMAFIAKGQRIMVVPNTSIDLQSGKPSTGVLLAYQQPLVAKKSYYINAVANWSFAGVIAGYELNESSTQDIYIFASKNYTTSANISLNWEKKLQEFGVWWFVGVGSPTNEWQPATTTGIIFPFAIKNKKK